MKLSSLKLWYQVFSHSNKKWTDTHIVSREPGSKANILTMSPGAGPKAIIPFIFVLRALSLPLLQHTCDLMASSPVCTPASREGGKKAE